MSTIVAEGVTVELGGRRVLDGVSLRLGSGVHVLLGANGSGKTTLLKVIAGLIKPSSGIVRVKGVVPWRARRRDVARIVGYVWQNPYHGFIEARVIDEITFILETLGVEGDWYIVEKLVPESLYERDPFTLSGGEARRVSIASVLVAGQDIWLLDEPFANLDSSGVRDLVDVIGYGRRRGRTIVVATHHVLYAGLVSPDTVILIDGGRVVRHCRLEDLGDSELLRHNVMPRGILCGEGFQGG